MDTLKELDNFYWNQPEPNRGCFLVLRDIILSINTEITAEWKYKLPFFYHSGKMFCYLWKDKKTSHPYIGIMNGNKLEHPALVQDNRKNVKILPINPEKDVAVDLVMSVLNMALELKISG